MPRLTHHTYCIQHDFLREVWFEDRAAWTELSPNEQWDLHDFFVPTQVFSSEELREYRQKITALDPSLPQRAGRALKTLQAAQAVWTAVVQTQPVQPSADEEPTRKSKSGERRISVKSLVRPEPDTERLAKALIGMAKEMVAADRAKTVAPEKDTHVDQDSAAA